MRQHVKERKGDFGNYYWTTALYL